MPDFSGLFIGVLKSLFLWWPTTFGPPPSLPAAFRAGPEDGLPGLDMYLPEKGLTPP
jgi:hypothetical protein